MGGMATVVSIGKLILEPNVVHLRMREWMSSYERPHWLKYIRIWEIAPTLPDDAVFEVMRDALAIGHADQVDALIREYGLVGAWRPSAIIVNRLDHLGSSRVLARDVIAHSLW